MSAKQIIRIGTRKPPLAMCQAEEAMAQLLSKAGDEYEFQIIGFTTTGDRIQDRALYDIGGKALFLKEVELALLNNEIDIAVHSLKDVPGIESPHLAIASLMKRKDARDVLISKYATTIADLPKGAVVGTASMRRMVFLKAFRPDLIVKTLRGNIITRMQKLEDGEYDAIILAAAGLHRLDMFTEHCSMLDPTQFIPAVGQGGLALQIRAGDATLHKLCRKVACVESEILSAIERQFLATLKATCKTPTSAHAYFIDSEKTKITINFMLAGKDLIPHFITKTADVGQENNIGIEAAQELQRIVKQHSELL